MKYEILSCVSQGYVDYLHHDIYIHQGQQISSHLHNIASYREHDYITGYGIF